CPASPHTDIDPSMPDAGDGDNGGTVSDYQGSGRLRSLRPGEQPDGWKFTLGKTILNFDGARYSFDPESESQSLGIITGEVVRPEDVRDGVSNTILVVEKAGMPNLYVKDSLNHVVHIDSEQVTFIGNTYSDVWYAAGCSHIYNISPATLNR